MTTPPQEHVCEKSTQHAKASMMCASAARMVAKATAMLAQAAEMAEKAVAARALTAAHRWLLVATSRYRPRMHLTAIQGKIAAGVLPPTNGIAVSHVRYTSGVCVGCDAALSSTDFGVRFDAGNGQQLLHMECYVSWTEACGE